ncbi:DUF6907 domain-containing protein [Streptomyces sp. NRRL F-5123]|uniref:DUF6907 domain-containing protein n=1 Tax=Streptomyces sp. NRRL F-5123 TaxID=1463856 RepID=UPI0004E12799|nr:hypothetical protein [Streptomyces sp. NRRL F-5123]
MSQRTEAPPAVAPSVPKVTLAATVPPSGKTSTTGKGRGFVGLPQNTETPEVVPAIEVEQCPVHPWCIERGDHTWHNSEPVTVHVECGVDEAHNHGHAESPYVEARLVSEDDPATGARGAGAAVMIGDCEVTAAGARREAAKLRAALPRIEALADILDGQAAYTPPTSYESAETIKAVGTDGALLKVYLFDPSREELGGYDGPRTMAVTPEMGSATDLDLDGAIDFRNQLAALLPKVDAMISSLAADVQTEPPKTPEAQPPARQWTITTDRGAKVTGHLPPWADTDPSKEGIPAGRLENHLEDVYHRRDYDGQTVLVEIPGDQGRYRGEESILLPHIQCTPHGRNPADRVPHVNVEAVAGGDEWIGPFDPAGVADFVAKLRAQADRLEQQVLPALVMAREDWAKNGGQK